MKSYKYRIVEKRIPAFDGDDEKMRPGCAVQIKIGFRWHTLREYYNYDTIYDLDNQMEQAKELVRHLMGLECKH